MTSLSHHKNGVEVNMYHGRFKGSHYEAGFQYGALLKNHGTIISGSPTFTITDELKAFAKSCLPVYREYYPEVLEEMQGMADGQGSPLENIADLLLPMYCFEPDHHCTAFAVSDGTNTVLCKNSDFLVSLEKLYMNCLYALSGAYAFNGNTTAFIQIEDGMNESGLAAALTFLYPHIRKPGLNAGMLTRYILEKCATTEDAISALKNLPIASAQTITLADRNGKIAVVECNPAKLEVIRPEPGAHFVTAANCFHSEAMKEYRTPPDVDSWRAEERYETARNALAEHDGAYSLDFCEDVLSGKYGFICQYDRKTNADTVWSAVYDVKNRRFYRVEGNPSRKPFKADARMKF